MKSRSVLLFFLLFAPLYLLGQLHSVKHFERENGLSTASLLSLNESEDGYIWLGSDGYGLVRFDGDNFKYINKSQKRENKHITDIFINDKKLYFTTTYSGLFELKNDSVVKLNYIGTNERNQGVVCFENDMIVIQNVGIKIFHEGALVNEVTTYPFKTHTRYYGYHKFNDILFVFTSKGSYFIQNRNIQSLSNWLGADLELKNDIVGVIQTKGQLIFFSNDLSFEYAVSFKRDGEKVVKYIPKTSPLEEGELVLKWASRGGDFVLLTNKSGVFRRYKGNGDFHKVEHNFGKPLAKATGVLIDKNHDIWISSLREGAYRVSLEPFTQLKENEVLKNEAVAYLVELKNKNMVLSTSEGKTYILDSTRYNTLNEFDNLVVRDHAYYKGFVLLGTSKGVYSLENNKLELFQPLADLSNKNIISLSYNYGYIWYAIAGKGLYRRDLETNEEVYFENAPAYYYNEILSLDSTEIYFGTNNGVYVYSKETERLSQLALDSKSDTLGYFVGNSTRDKFGTIWFSFDNGLLGIQKDKKQVIVKDEASLPSLLIYTLNADMFGNLYVGSNVGVTVVSVNGNGEVLSSKTYNKEEGFLGYETHMGVSFEREDGSILLGTIGGVTLIMPEHLKRVHTPNKPVIHIVRKNFEENLLGNIPMEIVGGNANVFIEFGCLNSKSSYVLYQHRLLEDSKEWSEWKPEISVNYSNLKSGDYTFEVRAKIYDGLESEITTLKFHVVTPFYKDASFFVPFIIFLTLLSLFFIVRFHKQDENSLNLISKDILENPVVSRKVLAVGAVVHTFTHIFAPTVDASISNHNKSAIIYGVVLLMYLFTLKFIKNQQSRIMKALIDIGALSLFIYNFWFLYQSDLHPFYLVNILVLSVAVPYMFKKIPQAVAFGVGLIAASLIVFFLVDNAVFDRYIFLITVGIVTFLVIVLTKMLNNDLNRLIFASGIVNKGNAPIIAFNSEGEIVFSSENIERLLGVEGTLKGRKVSYLSQFTPKEINSGKFENINLLETFEDNRVFASPFITKNGKIVYYQWSCKDFSHNLKVIMGQDITERVDIESNYELIVKNADSLIFRLDLEGNFTYLNSKSVEAFGGSIGHLLGSSFFNLVYIPEQSKVRSFFENSLQERTQEAYVEIPIVKPGHNILWIGLSLSIVHKSAAENMISGFLGIGRDVTEVFRNKEVIERQNKDIKDSISYASRIQINMLPGASFFKNYFEESYILYKPKNIVSGDFYWLNKVTDKIVLILADSTGHGVSGSFLTLLGINILDQIVLEAKTVDPAQILSQLEMKLIESLSKKDEEYNENTMEVVACVFDFTSSSFQYATAGGRFAIVNNSTGDVEIVRGNANHIGETGMNADLEFVTHERELTENHSIILFTDGYPDQFGGRKNKKLTFRKFVEALEEIATRSLAEQDKMLNDYLVNWMQNDEQTDDITVIGIKGVKK
ncbi:MAG TPA: SpoIIE family protein phosphatase [Brumimicrobium sp.]|nr:SpoIIE family protein phosphatase [Brumimicrobium sp.]